MQNFTIETSQGFVKVIETVSGELNGIAEYTNNRAEAKKFTFKRLKELRARSYFRYHSMTVIIDPIAAD